MHRPTPRTGAWRKPGPVIATTPAPATVFLFFREIGLNLSRGGFVELRLQSAIVFRRWWIMRYDIRAMNRRWEGLVIRPTTSGIMHYDGNETSRRSLHGNLSLAETQENEGPRNTPRKPTKTPRRLRKDTTKMRRSPLKTEQKTLECMSDEPNECKYDNYDKLDNFVNGLENVFNIFKFYCEDTNSGEVHKEQCGLIRTNCLDCLDRTNVVQSVIARQILHKVLNNEVSIFTFNAHFRIFRFDCWKFFVCGMN